MRKTTLLQREDEVIEEALRIEMEAFDIITTRVQRDFEKRREELSSHSKIKHAKPKSIKITDWKDVGFLPEGRYRFSGVCGWHKVKKRGGKNEYYER